MEMLPAANGSTAASSSKAVNKLHLLHLPRETLDTVFEYVKPRDLITLMLVSRTFHEIAASQLYRRLSHVFPNEDNRSGQNSVDYLAGILETLTTSDYNYAGHIKEISMDTFSTGEAAEKACREFKYQYSCGKFLNTLLLATLKKIRALETFRWNVRVEISQSVFTVLSKMSSLQHLHVRLQAGRSLHSPHPTLTGAPLMPTPGPVSIPPPPHHHHHHTHHHHHPPPPNQAGLGSYVPNIAKCSQCNGDGRPAKRFGVHKPTRTPQNFSRFSGLKSLAILDMDTLEYIPEIAECISSSSSSLSHLTLSFSESLALKARKKTSPDTSETDTVQDEDEFEVGIPFPPPPEPDVANAPSIFANTAAPASHEADIRRERAAQEKALSRIFSLEKETPQQRKLKKAAEQATVEADKEAQVTVSGESRDDVDRLFVTELQTILRELSRKKLEGGAAAKNTKSIETIEKAAAKYLERSTNAEIVKEKKAARQHYDKGDTHKHDSDTSQSTHSKADQNSQGNSPYINPNFGSTLSFLNQHSPIFPPPQPGPSGGNSSHNLSSKPTPVFSSFTSSFGQQGKICTPNPPSASGQGAKTQSSGNPKTSNVAKSSASTSETSDVIPQAGSGSTVATTNGYDRKFDDEFAHIVDMEHPDDDSEEAEDQVFLEDANDNPAEEETTKPVPDGASNNAVTLNGILENDLPLATDKGKGKEPVQETVNSDETQGQTVEYDGENAIQEYIRQNHGISLESLSIYLIPVRASVLSRAIDISALRHISLLNVGPQRAIWAMATKLHKTTPFQLKSVHTDNATPSLLVFLNGLDELTELFLIERNSRSKVEPLAPKTLVSMDDIKNQILRKHVTHLKRLVIRNDDDSSWALNRDAVRLVTKYGGDLKELGITLSPTNFHIFAQRIGRFFSLAALHINLTNNDNCPSVLREMRSCVIDNIMHCPHLKVEYVAVGHRANGNLTSNVAKLLRIFTRWAPDPSSKPVNLPGSKGKGKGKADEIGTTAEQSSFPSDSEDDLKPFNRAFLRVVDNLKPTDITGIKMWEKEIWELRI